MHRYKYIKIVILLQICLIISNVFAFDKAVTSLPKGIVQQVINNYGIDVHYSELIKLGVENDVYFLRSSNNKKYILRKYRNIDINRAEEEAVLLQILENDPRFFNIIVSMLPNHNGKYITQVDSATIFALFPYIEGKHPETLTSEQLDNIIALVHLIHKKGGRYTSLFKTRLMESIKSFDLFFYDLLKNKILQPKEYSNILAINYAFFNSLNKYSYRTIIHRDIHKTNIIIGNDGKLHLIDFDDFIISTPVLELSVIIRGTAFIKYGFDLGKTRVILKNYDMSYTSEKLDPLDVYNMLLYDLVRVAKARISKSNANNKKAVFTQVYNQIILLQKYQKEFLNLIND